VTHDNNNEEEIKRKTGFLLDCFNSKCAEEKTKRAHSALIVIVAATIEANNHFHGKYQFEAK